MSNYLIHHGILGQKWGVKNGPPYPLDDDDHSARENKAGWENSLGAKKNTPSEYKQKLVSEARKVDSSLASHLEKMSPSEIQAYKAQMERKKKAIIAGAIALGVTVGVAAILYAHRDSVRELASISKPTPEIAKEILTEKLKEQELILHSGDTLFRQVGFKDFDLAKAKDPLYVANNRLDADVYQLFLNDFVGNKERYEVTLKAAKDIKIAKFKDAEDIVENVLKKDPELREQIRDIYTKWSWGGAKNSTQAVINDMVKKGDVRDAFVKALQERGFGGVLDYHDINDKLTKSPMILFDPQKDLVKTGEKFITESIRKETFNNLKANKLNLKPLARQVADQIDMMLAMNKNTKISDIVRMKG